jgi:hypothetical protein
MLGPELFVGRFLDGPGAPYGVQSVDDARAVVRSADSLGYDFIKVYNSLTAEQYRAVMAEARNRGIAVAGHGVRSIGLEQGFAAGQSLVAHAEEYMYTDLRGRITDEHIPAAVAFTRKHGAYVLPNLSAYEAISLQWGKPDVFEEYLRRPEAQAMPRFWIDNWRGRDYVRRAGSIADRFEFLKRLTLALYRGGVPLLAGTDSPGIPGMVAGVSLHEDLRLLVEAGLPPFAAIEAATRNAGVFARVHLRSPDVFGLVARGHRADLVLVRENPLENVARLREPLAVMVRGRWLTAPQLRELVAAWSRP